MTIQAVVYTLSVQRTGTATYGYFLAEVAGGKKYFSSDVFIERNIVPPDAPWIPLVKGQDDQWLEHERVLIGEFPININD